MSRDGPAQKADLRTGDVLLSVAGSEVRELAALYRKVWSLGAAGVEIPFSIYRDGKTIETRLQSGDRQRFLKAMATARLARSWPMMCLSSSWTISCGVIWDMIFRGRGARTLPLLDHAPQSRVSITICWLV